MHCRNFSKSRRLRKPSEFSVVYKNNQTRAKGQYFLVLAFCRFTTEANQLDFSHEAHHPDTGRLGAVVSKKVSKLAVQRNRIKRLIRESFRHDSEHPDNYDFVIVARSGAAVADNVVLSKELNYLWRKIHKRCATV
ncbi:MAG: ribonuclease P protein component [Gammaproteobacteria bacterium]|nr:ribonuclease P protein component [Gammaproteobacteria bacterium]